MKKRHILWWMFLFLLVCNTLVVISINIAIVSMVNYSSQTNANETIEVICPNTTISWGKDVNAKEINHQKEMIEKFDWSDQEKNMVISGFFWLNWLAILPAGIISQKYGSKIVLGYAQGISSLMSSLIPIFASSGPYAVTYIRMVQGFFSVVAIPGALLTITGNWIPPAERGQFFSVVLLGISFGPAFGNIVFGYIAENLHWIYIFYFTSIVGLVWIILWYWLIYDTPEKHPTISAKERSYIMNALKTSADTEEIPIPWKDILTSFPFIICAITMGATSCHFILLSTYMPTYLKTWYGLDSDQIGFITSIPQFACGIGAFTFGFLVDFIVKKEFMSISHSRKCFAFFGGIMSTIPLIIIAYTHCNIVLVVICLAFAGISKNFNVFGIEIGLIDMSPRFCGVLQGFAGTILSIFILSLTSFINYLSGNYTTMASWQIIFLTVGISSSLFVSLYIMLGSSEVQPWNNGSKNRIAKRNEDATLFEKLNEN